MMRIQPMYAENIIVGILYENSFGWYVTDKELWFLNYKKLDDAYGMLDDAPLFEEPLERKNIKILDVNNIKEFLGQIKDQLYSSIELQRLLKEKRAKLKECGYDLLDYSPSLYIDFDHKTLYSLFPEPASYEDYVPDTWEGKYEDFTQYISSENRYWINESGQNLLEGDK